MKWIWKEIIVCLLMGLVVPGALLEISGKVLERTGEGNVETVATAALEATRETVPAAGPEIPVLWPDGTIEARDLEEYLVGVVLGEMPASFEGEALKAQAVAARTYAGKTFLSGGKHRDSSVCTDPNCCQAYVAPEEYLAKGGMPQAVEKVRSAVAATGGQVLTFEGNLIEATYFSCSGGSTEEAKAVWGTDFPYLQAVESPGEEEAQGYEETRTFSRETLELRLGITLPEKPEQWLGPMEKTGGQGVATLEIGGKAFTGVELRSLLDLRSTFFTAETGNTGLTIVTRGHGHRVGMSQYGADAMAAAGKDYRQILAHYYQGTEIQDFRGILEGNPIS